MATVTLDARAFAANNGDGVGREEGIASQARTACRAVEKYPVRQIAELLAAAHRIRGRDEIFDQGDEPILTHGGNQSLRARFDRAVSRARFDCSSSEGVR